MKFKNIKTRLYTSSMLFLLTYLIFNFNFFLIYCLIITGVLSLIEFIGLTRKIYKNNIYILSINILFLLYISIFCILFFFFSNYLQLKIILFMLLLSCAASDIGGFVFGKLLKGPKVTNISPNKTISGAVGSLILTCVTISSLFIYATNDFNYLIVIVGILTSLACQFGDLFFSYLKRKASIKDTGNFLPGHGGVLDRIDGILFGIPFGFIGIALLY